MDSKLKAYYDSVEEFEQPLIDWCCIDNKYCPEEYVFYLRDNKAEDYNKEEFSSNYYGNRTNKHVDLKEIDDKALAKLDSLMKTFDGTMLVSLVWKWMKEHKVFTTDSFLAPPETKQEYNNQAQHKFLNMIESNPDIFLNCLRDL